MVHFTVRTEVGRSEARLSLKYWYGTRASWKNAEVETSKTSAGG